jgi:hypothetical protein
VRKEDRRDVLLKKPQGGVQRFVDNAELTTPPLTLLRQTDGLIELALVATSKPAYVGRRTAEGAGNVAAVTQLL